MVRQQMKHYSEGVFKIFKDSIVTATVFMGAMGMLMKEVIDSILHGKMEWKLFFEQVYYIGVRSLGLILTTALSVGMVITLQSGSGLQRFGGVLYLPKTVSLSILWELGPLFTGLIAAARAGAGITSEIGSMMVTQQVDAMRALGTSPISKIVVPRVLATLVAVPVMVVITDFVAILGSMLISSVQFHLDPDFFVLKLMNNLAPYDFLRGFLKSVFYALFISIPACHYGLKVREGASEVGQATTKSVVVGSIFIFIGDFLLTKLLWLFA